VRAALAGCTVTPLTPDPPAASHTPAAERLALLALGDGFACGADGPTRADGAVVVLKGTLACWAPTRDCACVPQELAPGAVIGPLADTPPAAAGASTAP
jgi:hypothetical protein